MEKIEPKFSAKETCEKFLYTYKDIFKIQLVELFPNIKVREIMCIDSKSAKEIQKQLYGTKIWNIQSLHLSLFLSMFQEIVNHQ